MSSEIGKRLQEFRSMRGFSAIYMTQRIGVPRSTYLGWENGVGIRDATFYPKLAKALNVSISELLTGEPDSTVDLVTKRIDELVLLICNRIDRSLNEQRQN